MAGITFYEEIIFHINCEPLTASAPMNSVTKNMTLTPNIYRNSSWTLVLTRLSQELNITLIWNAGAYYDYNYGNRTCETYQYLSMNFVHYKRGIITTVIDWNVIKSGQPCKSKFEWQ